ncbi:hypothetical protein Vadar_025237 [Vaccinium darrowii]|uniref:Uncharacterized protein n=1 Tax=Vaccinium darrowii TaxID=229202 RepID=A0ACB7XTQ0_9ERIC|nr:hypothetical protein Vadar_025237 [Vaccinium darrowii]
MAAVASQKEKLVIIAMKGHTCTGKTRIANVLAQKFECRVIDLDDVYDCFSDHMIIQQQQQQQQRQLQQQIVQCLDRSFESVCRIAVKQLELIPVSKNKTTIIDSLLLLQSHMERLLVISKSIGARLVIVECRAREKYEWEQRFIRAQKRGTSSSTSYCSYKPSTWKDIQLETTRLGKYEYDTSEDVSKLVVDTTKHFKDSRLCYAVELLCKYKMNLSMDLQAGAGDSYQVVHKLTLSNDENDGGSGSSSSSSSRVVVSCRACLKSISSGPSYNCSHCDLSLHKLCAELPDKKQLLPHQNPPFVDPNSHKFIFPETHRCKFHPEGFDSTCHDCAFESNLRCALVPTVVYLECHQHPLFFCMISTRNLGHNSHFQCHACGNVGGEAFYACQAPNCGLILHVNCALLPPTREDIHHRHHLSLTPPPLPPPHDDDDDDDDSDEYYCNSCEETRNPRHWIYYCEKCEFASHLYCDGFSPS